jgi:hypothetical protein
LHYISVVWKDAVKVDLKENELGLFEGLRKGCNEGNLLGIFDGYLIG